MFRDAEVPSMSTSLLLFPPRPAPLATLEHLVARANEYAADARASSTRKAYRGDFEAFEAWCAARALVALPAAPATVAVYLAALAEQGRRPSTIERALAGIAHVHKTQGAMWTRAHPAIGQVMSGIRRRLGVAPEQ